MYQARANGLVSLFNGIVGLRLFIIVRVFDLCFIILVIIRHGLFRSFRLAALVCLEISLHALCNQLRIIDCIIQQPAQKASISFTGGLSLLKGTD